MIEKNKLVFFDFCETLIKFQTADKYIDFCRKRLHSRRMNLLQTITIVLTKSYCFRIIDRLLPNNTIRKRLVLSQLKGIEYTILNDLAKEYYEQCLKPAIIPKILNRLLIHLQSQDNIWIVSGGYDIYIKYFVEEYSLAGYISTNIAFTEKGICLGRFTGLDCMRQNKVYLIEKKLSLFLNNMDTVAYSDSISDLPLLLMTKEGFVVSKKETQKWAMENNLKEIVWE